MSVIPSFQLTHLWPAWGVAEIVIGNPLKKFVVNEEDFIGHPLILMNPLPFTEIVKDVILPSLK